MTGRSSMLGRSGFGRMFALLTAVAALTAGLTPSATAMPDGPTPAPEHGVPALLTRQAMSADELQAQVDLQLRLYPGGRQTASNEVSYDGDRFVVSYARPDALQARAADCPSGWFCFYEYTNYGWPRGRLSDYGSQDLGTWGWRYRTESVHNNTNSAVDFYDANYGFLFCMRAGAVSADVSPWRNQAAWVYRWLNDLC